jgi:hypothetical protein
MRKNAVRGASIHQKTTTGDVVCETEKFAANHNTGVCGQKGYSFTVCCGMWCYWRSFLSVMAAVFSWMGHQFSI